MPPRYKFVEVSPVTAETLEAAVNEWVAQGWELECIRFVVTEHSKRPQLAFVELVTTSGPVTSVTERPGPAPRPIDPPEQLPRVITAPDGDDVE